LDQEKIIAERRAAETAIIMDDKSVGPSTVSYQSWESLKIGLHITQLMIRIGRLLLHVGSLAQGTHTDHELLLFASSAADTSHIKRIDYN
jgi:hypothetical protein